MTHAYLIICATLLTVVALFLYLLFIYIKHKAMTVIESRYNDFFQYLKDGRLFPSDALAWKQYITTQSATQPPVKPA